MKTFITFSLFFFTTIAFGQSSSLQNINPIQAGTATIISGKAIINLDENTITSLSAENGGEGYVVVLTPLCNCGQFYISDKGSKSFTVTTTGKGSNNASFDYVVFLKYHLIPLNQNMQPVKFTPPAATIGK
jgi:hypothetical protein